MELPPILNDVPTITIPKSGKRKKPDDLEELRELTQRAKYHCKDIKEWRVVSKYNAAKLKTYLNDQEFLEGSQIAQSFGSFSTDVFGFVLDKLLKGEGFIETEIKNDITLKNTIQRMLDI